MGNRVSTLWCRKSNLAIKTNNESEHSSDHNQSKTKTNAFTSHKKRESKRRFRQRRLSLNCMTREADTPPNNEEPVQIHRNSNTLPRRLKLNTADSSKESLASSPNDTKVGENSEIQLPEVSNTNSSVFLPEIPIIAISDENSCENSVDVVDGPLPIPSALFGNLKKTVNVGDSPLASPKTSPLGSYKVLTSTKTDLLTRQKLTCSVATSQVTRMKINTDINTNARMSDFSDSSQSGVISPATSFIENFHKKNGTAATTSSSANTSPSINPSSNIGTTTTSPSINGGGSQIALAGGGRQINTSSSSSSSVKETSSTSSQQVSTS
uniref:Uncharacterized protein n=1 Tax=Stomoxys calcitrans TaxID=35570 RepID=A0A1I8PLK8_STOCA